MWMPRECTEATQVSVRWLSKDSSAPSLSMTAFPLLFTPASFVALSGRAKEKYKPLKKKIKIDQCVATKREARPSPCFSAFPLALPPCPQRPGKTQKAAAVK